MVDPLPTAPSQPPTPAPVVNDSVIQANQDQAAKLGVKIPGVGDRPATGATQPGTDTSKLQSVSLPNGTQASYDSSSGKMTANGTELKYQNGAWVDPSTGQPPTTDKSKSNAGFQGTVGSTDANGNPVLSDQSDRQALAQAQQEYQTQATNVQNTITSIQNGVTPLTAGETAQIDGLKQQFQVLIDQQNLQNAGATGTAQLRGYQTGAAEYDPLFQAKTIGTIVSAGAAKIADLSTKEASAVAQLTQSFKDNDIKAVQDAWNLYKDASKSRSDALQKTIDDTQKAIKDAQDAKIAADKVQYDTVTKPIQDLATNAAKNGADAKTIAAIGAAKSVDEAISAAGSTLQTSTDPKIAEYLYYKQQAQNSGVSPQSFAEYEKAQAQIAANQKYAEAFATAKGTAAGQAAGAPPIDTPTPNGLGGDSKGGSILAQTGLSIAAFNYLTQGTPSMSRMSASQRAAIMGEAQNWLNKNRIDVSTFQSQYKAYNDVLQKNITRANQTKIMAGEVSGSADALIQVIKENGGEYNPKAPETAFQGMKSVRAQNILDLMAGKEVNSPFAQKYSSQITFMANDLAGYLAAARGASSPELQDQRDAADIISNGMNKGSVEAFQQSINANEQKVAGVVSKAVTDTQKQVWGLFGVADKYASPTDAAGSMIQQQNETSQKVDDYIKQNPTEAPQISKLYSQGYTDEQIQEYLATK